ncbi:MAG: hypothetical protein ACOCXA_02020 [Planctomycetota bacterium]
MTDSHLDRQQSDQPNRLMLILLPAESVSYLDQQVDTAKTYLYNVFAGLANVFGNS